MVAVMQKAKTLAEAERLANLFLKACKMVQTAWQDFTSTFTPPHDGDS